MNEEPRFKYADECAHSMLVRYGVSTLPTSPLDFLNMYPDVIRVHTYSECMKKWDCTRNEVIDQFYGTSDGITFYCDGKYRVFYNDAQRPLQRIRWTLSHELGHIALDHFSYSETRSLDVLDREADAFASEFLAPALVLFSVGAFSADEIKSICDISDSAATYKSNFLNRIEDKYYLTGKYDRELLSVFDNYINSYRCTKKRGNQHDESRQFKKYSFCDTFW